MISLIAFDLDGTLTQHRTPIEEKNTAVLKKLGEKYRTVIVGAGACQRIYRQLNNFPIDIVGNYGMQESTVVDGNFVLLRDEKESVDKEEVLKRVERIRRLTGYTEYKGLTIEFHESGCLTFPLIGTGAAIEDKLAFDPDRKKRRKIYELVKAEFHDYTVFIGGSSSFDIVPKKYNKYLALMKYASEKGIGEDEIIYVGDDFQQGGNDEHIFKSNIKCIEVDDYRNLDSFVGFLYEFA
jgi:HAD superfamily hydrolase (TIGR01484 family)